VRQGNRPSKLENSNKGILKMDIINKPNTIIKRIMTLVKNYK